MKLELPDDILLGAETTTQELRIALAVQLYSDGRVDYCDACRLAGVNSEVLDRELADRDISIVRFPPISVWRENRRAG